MSDFIYPHPEIVGIDLDRAVVSNLQNFGLNIEWGTFGNPYHVSEKNEFFPVIPNHNLPENLTDKKVIIIDLCQKIYFEKQPDFSGSFLHWGQPNSSGIINPRYLSMDLFRKDFDRIYNNGGIFIIFANSIDVTTLEKGERYEFEGYLIQTNQSKIIYTTKYSNYSFLSEISSRYLDVRKSFGTKIISDKSFISNLLSEYQNLIQYYCLVYPVKNTIKRKWLRLARETHNLTVSGAINKISAGKGLILLLPNIPDLNHKSIFLFKLITEYLPKIVPDLCKKITKKSSKNWLYLPEYEIPKIQKVKNKLAIILAEHEKRLSKLENLITEARKKSFYWHDLITQQDRPLIDAVKKAFEILGYQEIIEPNNNQEDLQIKDYLPILLLEIIGTSESRIDDTKVWRYLAPRMQEYQTFEIKGLIIVNHQKNIPPLERDNENIFSEKILNKAREYNLGLMTTWNLYLLIKNALKFGWKHEQIKDIFYQNGKIDPIPSHYQYIGIVEYFDKLQNIVSIQLEKLYLQKEDTIAFDFIGEIEEQKIETIEQNDENTEIIEIGNLTAEIATKLSKLELDREIRVFKIVEEEF